MSSASPPFVTIPNRPFSTEIITGLMLPNGIFESALGNQRLNAHFRNEDANSVSVNVYVESVSDPHFVVTPQTFNVNLPSGASHLFSWDVNVSRVPPGVYQVSFIAENAGGQTRIIKKIFVTRVQFDPTTKTFTAQAPEGILQLSFKDLIAPKVAPGCGDRRRNQGKREHGSFLDQVAALFKGHEPGFKPCLPGYLPHDLIAVMTPTPAYAGQYGDLPFQDPWWKLVLAIVAAVLGIAGAIAEAVGGTGEVTVSGTSSTGGSGGDCCGVQAEGGGTSYVAAGLLAAAATVALIAAASDVRDPWRRGQDHTPPAPGELTVGEQLTLSISYPEPVVLGKPFTIDAKWEYIRITTGESYTYAATDTHTNTHTLSKYNIDAPDVVRAYKKEQFIVRAEFFDQDGKSFRGDQLFVQCILAGPQGQYRSFLMQDNGIYPDRQAGDGEYTGELFFTEEDHGIWMFFVIAQDINTAQPDMDPEQAAQIIGGLVRTHQLTINFEGGTCPFVPDGDVHIISSLGG